MAKHLELLIRVLFAVNVGFSEGLRMYHFSSKTFHRGQSLQNAIVQSISNVTTAANCMVLSTMGVSLRFGGLKPSGPEKLLQEKRYYIGWV